MIDITGEIAAAINEHQEMVFRDALRHDLFYLYEHMPPKTKRQMAILRIMEECNEAYLAADSETEWGLECADIILCAESLTMYNGVRIGDYVQQKRAYNMDRPKRHGQRRPYRHGGLADD